MKRKFGTYLSSKLMRITTTGKIIREIDGLRFLAILPVIIQHISERLFRYSYASHSGFQGDYHKFINTDMSAYWISRGTVGVFVFFAISGFVLSFPFAKHYLSDKPAVNLKKYFWRRVTRLEPPYIVIMTLLAIALIVKGDFTFLQMIPHYIASIFYQHNLYFQDYSIINPVAWSLEIEIQFYILAPLLAYLVFSIKPIILRRGLLIAYIFVFITLQSIFNWHIGLMKMTIFGQLPHFLVGFLIADIFLTEWEKEIKKSYLWDLIGIIALILLMYTWTTEYWKNLVFALSLFTVLFSVFKGNILNAFFTNTWIMVTGGMCYSIYLIHLPIVEFLTRLIKPVYLGSNYIANLGVYVLIIAPVIMTFSIIYYLIIEKPCMDKDWPQKLKAYFKRTFSF
ncbi:MAG: acyltransferase [Bacteroidetes bacterium]|nr:acyltransferase [Bacteroidota bacterium]